jgi:predicted nucleotidyltransferase
MPDVAAQLEALVAGLRGLLGDALVGVYLEGSLLLGGFGPRSDVDVLALVTRSMTDGEKRRLAELLLQLSGRPDTMGPPHPIELNVVVERDMRPWRYPPATDFHYGEPSRAAIEAGRWPSGDEPDLAAVIAVVRTASSSLFGPPPAEALPAVPRADYVDAILEDFRNADRIIERYPTSLILALARIWADLATGEIRSKADAVPWALERLPPEQRLALARAWAIQEGHADRPWDDIWPAVEGYAAHLTAIIEECLTQQPSPSSAPRR